MESIKWKYNGKLYNTRRELKDEFGWSTCKFDIKLKENKIIKITEEHTYEDNSKYIQKNK